MFCFHALNFKNTSNKGSGRIDIAHRQLFPNPRGIGTLAYLLMLVVMLATPLFAPQLSAQNETADDASATDQTQPAQAAGTPPQESTENDEQNATDNADADADADGETPASPPTPTLPPRQAIDIKKMRIEQLTQEVNQDELRWLTADGEKFMALWRGDLSGRPFGATLILHTEGESVDTPYSVSALRNNLNLHGWATLAIAMPATKAPQIPRRPPLTPAPNSELDATDTQPALPIDTEETTAPDPQTLSTARIEAAIAFLKQQGQYNIALIAHGTSALRAARFISESAPGDSISKKGTATKTQRPIRALVLVGARNQITGADASIETFFTDVSLPILDVIFADHYLHASEASVRKHAARRRSLTHFFQYQMLRPTQINEADENELTRRVRGFLYKNARGVEVERKR